MKHSFYLSLAVLLLAVLPAFAKTKKPADDEALKDLKLKLYTPTLWCVKPDGVACNLVNLSSEPRQVRVRIFSNGVVVKDSDVITLQPFSAVDSVFDMIYEGGEGDPYYCEFAMEGKDKNEYRGVVKVFPWPNGSDLVALAAT